MAKNIFSKKFISLGDMYLAYRKAKSEAFFDNLHPSALRFAEFERNLQSNLEALHKKITKGDLHWWEDIDFIGEHLYVPKSLDDSPWDNSERVHFRLVDPITDWEHRYRESGRIKLDAQYRLIISATPEYQIISALWIIKVGHKFEGKLNKNLSYGNRLRRKRHFLGDFSTLNGPINKDSLGLFSPYFSAYRNWRQNGLDAMRRLVNDGRPATAITMDLAGFYHNVSPSFVLKPSFLKAIGITLEANEKKFTQLLIDSINFWYRRTPDYLERKEGALPVGLSASKILSNILLYELDNQIAQKINPTYYGRYVDDIFLVFETPTDVQNGDQVLNYLASHIDCLKIHKVSGKRPDLRLKFGYARDSDLQFTSSKQKIFSLSSKHGLDLIDQISSQIRAQSSEYRMLPDVPESSSAMAEKALLASPDASLIADALRKADSISIRRLGLSLLIRDIESYSIDLSRDNWKEIRNEFYELVDRHLITPKGLFDLFGYFTRVFRLMISNYDFKQAESFICKIDSCLSLVRKTTSTYHERNNKIKLCQDYFSKILIQTSLQASTTRGFDQWAPLRRCLIRIFNLSEAYKIPISKKNLQNLSREILLSDFGTRPYKDYWHYNQIDDINFVKVPRNMEVKKVLRLASIRKFRECAQLKLPHWPALAFPTRPLSIQEIALICPSVLDNKLLFKRIIWGLRGAKTASGLGVERTVTDADGCFVYTKNKDNKKVHVALTNFKTTNEQFSSALRGNPDLSLDRYKKINKLINEILSTKPVSDYVVFPECSLPRRWASNIAAKLARQGISLIAGIEHYEFLKGDNITRNDCMISLATRWPGYPSNFLFAQPKLKPSHEEGAQIKAAGKRLYEPKKAEEIIPIYGHGGFYFGVLICSDLTNPENRARFQGKIDTLFVLEWNPDVKTFSFLIEGSSHDIHTFVVQVNNRMYGDSRLRAPYRTEYKRDAVRIKGGLSDYFVISDIDYQSLRKFQRKRNMTDQNSEFKPVPIGFRMANYRRKTKST